MTTPPLTRKGGLRVFVGVALASAFLGFCGLVIVISHKQKQAQELMAAREVIDEQLRVLLQHRDVLAMAARLPGAAPGNLELAACILGGVCRATDATHPVGFVLRSGLEVGAETLAGTDEEPAHYALNGAPGCDPKTDAGCPGWRARAWFWAECPDGAAQCDHPRAIRVAHRVDAVAALPGLPESPTAAGPDPATAHLAAEVKL